MYEGGSADDLTVQWNSAQNAQAIMLLGTISKCIAPTPVKDAPLQTIFSKEDERIHQIVVDAQTRAREQIGRYDSSTDRDLTSSETIALRQASETYEVIAYGIRDSWLREARVVPDFKKDDAKLSSQEQRAYQIWDQLHR